MGALARKVQIIASASCLDGDSAQSPLPSVRLTAHPQRLSAPYQGVFILRVRRCRAHAYWQFHSESGRCGDGRCAKQGIASDECCFIAHGILNALVRDDRP